MNGNEDESIHGLLRKPEGKKPLGKPKPMWQDNMKHDIR
jgi:hypothetical protein